MVYNNSKGWTRPVVDEQTEIARTKIPARGEVIGVVTEMLGGGKMRVDCDDKNARICRICGKMRKKIWIKVGDMVLIRIWVVQENERGDVIWKYTRTQAYWLKRTGRIKNINYE